MTNQINRMMTQVKYHTAVTGAICYMFAIGQVWPNECLFTGDGNACDPSFFPIYLLQMTLRLAGHSQLPFMSCNG